MLSPYYQPKWKGRKKVKHFVAALMIGAATVSLHYIYKQKPQGWDRETVVRVYNKKTFREPLILSVTVFLTSGSTWLVPSNFGSLTSVECLAAGSSGNSQTAGGNRAAGGGGAYAKITSTTTTLTPGVTSINVGIGTGGAAVNGTDISNAGGDTWWNATSRANAVTLGSSVACAAQGGQATSGGTGGLGGTAANSVGTTKFSGGNGSGSSSSNGGGGAAGGSGAGGNGSNTQGGSANNGTVAGPTTDANGNSGTNFDATHGSGTGAFTTGVAAQTGGLYGGAGTATTNGVNSGPGANGLIVIIFAALVPVTGNVSTFSPRTRRIMTVGY